MGKTIFAKTLYTGSDKLDDALVSIENGKIAAVQPSLAVPAEKDVLVVDQLAPGFIDIHINGGEQLHFTDKADAATLLDISTANRKYGTAYCLPTLITSPVENIIKGIRAVKEFIATNPRSGVLGMHLEGPFLSPEKRGAHLLKYIQQPNDAVIRTIIAEGKETIKIITLAPELFTASQLELVLESGIGVSAGHSNATYSQAVNAFNQGIHLVTHLYNAMSPFTHRSPGLVGAALEDDRVFAPIIVDGVHCDFAAVRIASRMKREKLILISDALFLGFKVKEFKWGSFDASLKKGKYINSEGNLAGASIPLSDGVRNAVEHLNISIQQAVEMSSSRPAQAIGMEKNIGFIQIGYPAVFTTFTSELTDFQVLDLS